MADSGCPPCSYVFDFYMLWTIRSTILKAGSILLMSALLIDLVAMVTNHWLVLPDGSGIGLFAHEIPSTSGTPTMVPILCPILGTLSTLVLLSANVLNVLLATRQFLIIMPAVIVFSFIAALMLMTVVVTWSIPHVTSAHDISWSFIMATVAVVVDMAGCGLCVMEFLSRRERPRQLDPSVVIPLQQFSSLDSDSSRSSLGGEIHRSQIVSCVPGNVVSQSQSDTPLESGSQSGDGSLAVGQSVDVIECPRQSENVSVCLSQSHSEVDSVNQSPQNIRDYVTQSDNCSESVT